MLIRRRCSSMPSWRSWILLSRKLLSIILIRSSVLRSWTIVVARCRILLARIPLPIIALIVILIILRVTSLLRINTLLRMTTLLRITTLLRVTTLLRWRISGIGSIIMLRIKHLRSLRYLAVVWLWSSDLFLLQPASVIVSQILEICISQYCLQDIMLLTREAPRRFTSYSDGCFLLHWSCRAAHIIPKNKNKREIEQYIRILKWIFVFFCLFVDITRFMGCYCRSEWVWWLAPYFAEGSEYGACLLVSEIHIYAQQSFWLA